MRRTDPIEITTLEYFFGGKTFVMPKSWWLQLCITEPTDSSNGGMPTVESGLRTRRRISNTMGTWSFSVENYRVNRWVIYSTTAKENVSGIGWFELWDQISGGTRWFIGTIIDPATEMPTTVSVATGKRIRFTKGSLKVKEE